MQIKYDLIAAAICFLISVLLQVDALNTNRPWEPVTWENLETLDAVGDESETEVVVDKTTASSFLAEDAPSSAREEVTVSETQPTIVESGTEEAPEEASENAENEAETEIGTEPVTEPSPMEATETGTVETTIEVDETVTENFSVEDGTRPSTEGIDYSLPRGTAGRIYFPRLGFSQAMYHTDPSVWKLRNDQAVVDQPDCCLEMPLEGAYLVCDHVGEGFSCLFSIQIGDSAIIVRPDGSEEVYWCVDINPHGTREVYYVPYEDRLYVCTCSYANPGEQWIIEFHSH